MHLSGTCSIPKWLLKREVERGRKVQLIHLHVLWLIHRLVHVLSTWSRCVCVFFSCSGLSSQGHRHLFALQDTNVSSIQHPVLGHSCSTLHCSVTCVKWGPAQKGLWWKQSTAVVQLPSFHSVLSDATQQNSLTGSSARLLSFHHTRQRRTKGHWK